MARATLAELGDQIDRALTALDHAELRRLGRMAARRGPRGRAIAASCRAVIAAEHARDRAFNTLSRRARWAAGRAW